MDLSNLKSHTGFQRRAYGHSIILKHCGFLDMDACDNAAAFPGITRSPGQSG